MPKFWTLVWADEFDTPGRPDPKNWRFETGFVRNRELQWYQPDNARCENSVLIIEARRAQRPNPRYRPNARETNWRAGREHIAYTSASLTTRRLHTWQYGRFEMRARIDTRAGLWSAFWTMGVSGRWPFSGEIDIMEYYRGTLLANAAFSRDERGNTAWHIVRKPLEELGDSTWPDRFHVWRMDWDKDFIKLYVDEVLLNEVDLATTINGDGTGVNPFHQPHYMLLNLAVGGTNGGDPSDTTFPGRFEVDYIRVYQRQADVRR